MPFFGDLRSALRILLRSPAYAVTCVGVLALGIGANAAIFSVVYSVVLAPLPYPDASRLVFVWQRLLDSPDPLFNRIEVSRKNYLEWQKQADVFDEMAAFNANNLEETGTDHPRHVATAFASANLFRMLGVRAPTGRLFRPDEERQGRDRVAVLSDAYFEQRFHRNPAALGRAITLGGTAYTVAGVLPPKFHLPATSEGRDQIKPDVWVPLSRLWNTPQDDQLQQLYVIARLKRGVPLAPARAEMIVIAQRLARAGPKQNERWTATVFPFAVEDAAPTLHRALYVLLATVAFLLLIACANLANLTLARATARSREVAVRLALGATRTRIIAQLLAESLLVSVAGAVAGLLLARWCIQLMLALKPPDIQRPELIGLNPWVFGFAAALSVLTTLLFGLPPAITVSQTDLNTTLKMGGRSASVGRLRSRQFLIAAEVALALILVSGAGLMIRSFQQLVAGGIGFSTQHLITADVDLPARNYPDGASQSRVFLQLMDRVRAIPGVTSAAMVDNLPLHSVSASNFWIAGRPDPPGGSLQFADHANMSPEYFSVIGLRLLAGRRFTEADRAAAEKDQDGITTINQSLARQFFNGQDPLGQRLLSPDKKRSFEIVGVVSDYRPLGGENPVRPEIFWPYLKLGHATLIARASGAMKPLAAEIQRAIWSLDRDIPESKVLPMDYYLDEWQSQRKFNTLLLGIFAGLALLLAMIGIYGVLSNLVTSRVREIGIRMAIGAAPSEIARLMLRQSMIPILIGLAAGLAGTLALSRFLEALLFHVRARDPLTLALAASAILLISPLALFVPLRRATRVDCTVALREE